MASTQVLATVISQAKLVVSEILEPSAQNEYAHAVAALPAVQDLCFSVFGSGGGGGCPPPSLYTAATGVADAALPGTAGVTAAGASVLGDAGRAGAVANGFGAVVSGGGGGGGGGGAAGGPPRAARQRAR